MERRSLFSMVNHSKPHRCIDCKKYIKNKNECRPVSPEAPKKKYTITPMEALEYTYCDFWEAKR